MLRTIFWYISGWGYLVLTVPMLLILKVMEKKNKGKAYDCAYRATQKLCRVLFKLTGSTIRVTGQENIPKEGAVLFVSNHRSHIDSAVIHGYINKPKGFISISEAKKFPIIRTWMEMINCVFINRKDLRQTLRELERSVEYLNQGHSMVLYPEGKLIETDEIGEFQKGGLRIAIRAGIPIVPITLQNCHLVMDKNGKKIRAANVNCIISKPIYLDEVDHSEKILIHKVREVISSVPGTTRKLSS